MSEPVSPEELEMILDALTDCMYPHRQKLNRKRKKEYFDLHQKVGQALGGKGVTIIWEEVSE